MDHLELSHFLALLIAILGAAKFFGALAQWIGQPTVWGELLAGVVLSCRKSDFIILQNFGHQLPRPCSDSV
jgi:Kef-type K+ transport system membrane component KefB